MDPAKEVYLQLFPPLVTHVALDTTVRDGSVSRQSTFFPIAANHLVLETAYRVKPIKYTTSLKDIVPCKVSLPSKVRNILRQA